MLIFVNPKNSRTSFLHYSNNQFFKRKNFQTLTNYILQLPQDVYCLKKIVGFLQWLVRDFINLRKANFTLKKHVTFKHEPLNVKSKNSSSTVFCKLSFHRFLAVSAKHFAYLTDEGRRVVFLVSSVVWFTGLVKFLRSLTCVATFISAKPCRIW